MNQQFYSSNDPVWPSAAKKIYFAHNHVHLAHCHRLPPCFDLLLLVSNRSIRSSLLYFMRAWKKKFELVSPHSIQSTVPFLWSNSDSSSNIFSSFKTKWFSLCISFSDVGLATKLFPRAVLFLFLLSLASPPNLVILTPAPQNLPSASKPPYQLIHRIPIH